MSSQLLEVPVKGMDCAECASHMMKAIVGLPGMESASMLLNVEKAVIRLDPARIVGSTIRAAVVGAGDTLLVAMEASASASTDFNPILPLSEQQAFHTGGLQPAPYAHS